MGSVTRELGTFTGKGRKSVRIDNTLAPLQVLQLQNIVHVLVFNMSTVAVLGAGHAVFQSNQAKFVSIEKANSPAAMAIGTGGLFHLMLERLEGIILVPKVFLFNRLDGCYLNQRGKLDAAFPFIR